ncbi:isochorismatase family protein [Janthinobacterium sp.]|uniref:isochorismatase family protein n=1 Tax=Janthinobacterium sp. TaxID=1871054 RepID=UPI002589C388|nr:isochorismatase family protein [Janthinobacterium sp.]MCX7290662.1 isochorismatase family protein [Janthinobacterium sp.]
MLMDANQAVLVIVDLQGRLMPAIHDAGLVLAQNLRLAKIARLLDVPVLGTEQNRQGLGPNMEEIAALCERTLHKTHFGACFDGLQAILPPGRRQIVVTGCEAHVCMLQTAIGLPRLDRLGAQLVTVEMLAFEWLRDCKHPRFREVLALIK